MVAPCSAVAALALHRNRLSSGIESHISTNSTVNPKRITSKLGHDCQLILESCQLSSSGTVDMTTLNTLHRCGLISWLHPASRGAAESTGSTGWARKTRRWHDRKQKCSSHGGLIAKQRANLCRTPLLSILLANVRSVENKLDYLRLDLTVKREVRDCCVIIRSEMWLNPLIPDKAVSIEGLTTFRHDRCSVLSGKTRGGGAVQTLLPTQGIYHHHNHSSVYSPSANTRGPMSSLQFHQ